MLNRSGKNTHAENQQKKNKNEATGNNNITNGVSCLSVSGGIWSQINEKKGDKSWKSRKIPSWKFWNACAYVSPLFYDGRWRSALSDCVGSNVWVLFDLSFARKQRQIWIRAFAFDISINAIRARAQLTEAKAANAIKCWRTHRRTGNNHSLALSPECRPAENPINFRKQVFGRGFSTSIHFIHRLPVAKRITL